LKVVTILGARPQFIKAAAVSPHLRREHEERIIHTGQHYDYGMSDTFFKELALPDPDYSLGVGSGSHGEQTGRMLALIEGVLLRERPDWALVYGDTNSTLAGALAAVKLHIPVAHVEAGLRCSDLRVPEEVNRLLTDRVSRLLLAPTRTAVRNLAAEGLRRGVRLVGDVIYDVLLQAAPSLEGRARSLLPEWGLRPGGYVLATIHRPRNVDDPLVLRTILRALRRAGRSVLLPLHPRTRKNVDQYGLRPCLRGLTVVPPLGYGDMLTATGHAGLVVTDSGGVQREAYMLGVPCVTLRDRTEWVETVAAGWNRLLDPAGGSLELPDDWRPPAKRPPLFGDGSAGLKVVQSLSTSVC